MKLTRLPSQVETCMVVAQVMIYLDGARNATGPGTVSWVADSTYDLIKAKLLTIIIR